MSTKLAFTLFRFYAVSKWICCPNWLHFVSLFSWLQIGYVAQFGFESVSLFSVFQFHWMGFHLVSVRWRQSCFWLCWQRHALWSWNKRDERRKEFWPGGGSTKMVPQWIWLQKEDSYGACSTLNQKATRSTISKSWERTTTARKLLTWIFLSLGRSYSTIPTKPVRKQHGLAPWIQRATIWTLTGRYITHTLNSA